MKEVRTLFVDAGEDGTRLDRWFKRRWPHLNHIQIQKLARSGQIREERYWSWPQPPDVDVQGANVQLRFDVPENSARLILQRLAKVTSVPSVAAD